MLKKRKHKIKRRNTEPSVNHALALASGGAEAAGPSSALYGGAMGGEIIPEHPVNLVNFVLIFFLCTTCMKDLSKLPLLFVSFQADICDSPTHATAV